MSAASKSQQTIASLLMVAVILALLMAALAMFGRDGERRAAALPTETFEDDTADDDTTDPVFDGYNRPGKDHLCDLNPLACGRGINVQKKLFFGDPKKSKQPCPNGDCGASTNNTDPYYMEKVQSGLNNSSLRVTINDDPDESLEIWGNSCAAGDCAGSGKRQHRFRADGSAAHIGGTTFGDALGRTPQDWWGFNHGVHTYNPVKNMWSHLPWKDGKHYLRGDVVIDGNASANGHLNVQKKLFFGDPKMTKESCPNGDCGASANNTDPYYMEKVRSGTNNSSLRVTINDDAEESLEIWGNSCAAGDCAGSGKRQHRFRADGSAAHIGGATFGDAVGRTPQDWWGFNHGVHTYNPVKDMWSHLPWKDGKHYLRGDVVIDGATSANGNVVVKGDKQLCIGGTCITETDLQRIKQR